MGNARVHTTVYETAQSAHKHPLPAIALRLQSTRPVGRVAELTSLLPIVPVFMAQVCGDSSFDFLWDRQHDVALGVLRKAADSWAIGGPNELSSDAVIAVMFRIYLSEWPEYGGIRSETRDLHVWLQVVPPARDELATRRPSADPLVLATVLSATTSEFSRAIPQWTLRRS